MRSILMKIKKSIFKLILSFKQNYFLKKKKMIFTTSNLLIHNILKYLTKMGYIYGFKFTNHNNLNKNYFIIYLKYYKYNQALLFNTLILNNNKTKLFKYIKLNELKKIKNFTSIILLYTSSYGILNQFEAIKYNTGGFILLIIN